MTTGRDPATEADDDRSIDDRDTGPAVTRRVAAGLLLVLVLAAGGWMAWQRWGPDDRGRSHATWLIVETATPTPASTAIEVEVRASDCGGDPDTAQAEVRAEPDRVVVTVTVDDPGPGFHTCAQEIGNTMTVDLGEPLGDRPIVDGGCDPAAPAVTPGPEHLTCARWPAPSTT